MRSAVCAEHGNAASNSLPLATLRQCVLPINSYHHSHIRRLRRARRVQNMGWTANNSLWLATRGGDVFFSPTPGVSEKFDQARLGSRGFGILDVACAPRTCEL